MQTIDNIPVYQAQVPENDEGFLCVSLVDYPAVQSNFVAFNAQRRVVMSAVADEEKRRVYGVIMRANYPIYRQDHTGEYYIVFTSEIIRHTAEKYFVDGRQNQVNLMHAPASQVEGVHLVQFFIKDTAAGISPAGFEDIEEGSLFGEYHVTDEKIWAAIKAGDYRGFSIEGKFTFTSSTQHFNPHNTAMSKLEKFKAGLAKLLVQLGAVSTDKGAIFWDGDEDLKAGDSVYVEEAEGERKPAPDGDYTTDDGKTIKVASGKVAEITDPKAEVEARAQGEGGEGASEGEAAKDPDKTPDPDGEEGDMETLRKELAEVKRRQEESDKRLSDIEASLEKVLTALDKTNVELRAIRKTPAAPPAHQQFKTAAPIGKTGNAELDRITAMLGGE